MSLLQQWRTTPKQLQDKHIRQLIAFAGDGKLRDGNDTCTEFREFLREIPSDALTRYATECLDEPFSDNGFALQDIINEMGRRLGFEVENGRYRGVKGQVGHDGLWKLPGETMIVVEVKVSDAYRFDLNTVAAYSRALARERRPDNSRVSTLIVVGRTDTGDLETQIRGSRHAWDMRLISVDALSKLVGLKEAVEDPQTLAKIHDILVPKEFTKLDEIVELVFSTAEEAKQTQLTEDVQEELIESTSRRDKKFTPVAYHDACVERISAKLKVPLIKRTRASFSSPAGDVVLVCAVSKTHEDRAEANYWFAFHPHQRDLLLGAKKAFVGFGCGSPDKIVLIPFQEFDRWLPGMNMTQKTDRSYWHVQIFEEKGVLVLVRKKGEPKIALKEYTI